jgi:hypothetical protein
MRAGFLDLKQSPQLTQQLNDPLRTGNKFISRPFLYVFECSHLDKDVTNDEYEHNLQYFVAVTNIVEELSGVTIKRTDDDDGVKLEMYPHDPKSLVFGPALKKITMKGRQISGDKIVITVGFDVVDSLLFRLL